MENQGTDNSNPTRYNSAKSFFVLVFILICVIGAQIWSYAKITRLEETVGLQSAALQAVGADLITAKTTINTQANQIIGLAADLDYVSSIAENANQWAHTHY